MISAGKSKANANPTKAFFVRMITRDITLEDCIFDLIDNSIDGAWELAGGQPMALSDNVDLSPYIISIEITEDRFTILDNCGGISLDDAVDYAFTFGRKEEAEAESFSIGVYGIGMKRAVFKIGTLIDVQSTYRENSDLASFRVPINVDDWLGRHDGDWDFDIDDSEHLAEAGVRISVAGLTESAARSFESPRFIQNLRRSIARDYALHLHRGLTIEVNGEPVQGWLMELRQGGEFAPMRAKFSERLDDEDVHIEILAGMMAPPPDDSEPSEDFDEDLNTSGWYIVCNGRIVLAADKTAVSGWGSPGWPQWHPQYTGFLGIILFASRRADLLPLTTTKRSVDETSAIFRQYRPHMRDVSKEWVAYTNHRKRDREESMAKEQAAKAVAIYDVQDRKEVELPKVAPKKTIPQANVLYMVPKDKLRDLASALGNINMPYKDVGLKSFNYAYEDLVGDE